MKNKEKILFAGGIPVLMAGMLLAVCLGSMELHIGDLIHSIFQYTGTLEDMMIVDVRLPRTLCAMMVGGTLAMTGALLQGVTRNPIADPSILGIHQGATFFIALCYGIGVTSTWVTNLLAALLGAVVIGFVVLFFMVANPANRTVSRLLLAGTAIAGFLVSLTTIIGLLTNQSQMIGFWVSGGFRTASWTEAVLAIVVGIVGFVIACIMAEKINVVSLGEEVAIGLGVKPEKVRWRTFLLLIPLCAMTVAVGRTIGFVGMIIPQIVRMLFGEDYRKIIPFSFLLGAILLVYADIAARLVYDPYEVPIGVFTSLLGVPFFLYMAGRSRT